MLFYYHGKNASARLSPRLRQKGSGAWRNIMFHGAYQDRITDPVTK